jgi:membrane protease YdiL (CAAX protease family)
VPLLRPNLKKSLVFIFLAFIFSWSLAGIYYISGGRLNQPMALLVLILYMFIPSVAAAGVQKFIYKEHVKDLGIHFRFNRWFWLAWLVPAVVAFTALGVSLLLPGVEFAPDMAGLFERYRTLLSPEQLEEMRQQVSSLPVHFLWVSLAQGLVAGLTINAVAGFGEELGWRGLLQQELAFLGFWRSSLLIGFIWGLWHAPIIIQGYNYPQHPVAGVFMMIAMTTLLGPIFSYFRVKSGSVLTAAVAHGTFNGTAGIATVVVQGGNDLTIGVLGLSGIISMALILIVIFIFDRHVKEPSI